VPRIFLDLNTREAHTRTQDAAESASRLSPICAYFVYAVPVVHRNYDNHVVIDVHDDPDVESFKRNIAY